MLFRTRFLKGIADGSITLTVRAWSRPQAREGGRYRVGDLLIEVTSLRQMPVASLTLEHAARAGFQTLECLLGELGRTSRASPGDEARAWLVEFRCLGLAPEPTEPMVDPAAIAAATARLHRLDRAAAEPWTERILAWIDAHPGVAARRLAEELGRDRLEVKADVRKLKGAGLTRSLVTGYELTGLGRAMLQRHPP
jgi:hypothetical protein